MVFFCLILTMNPSLILIPFVAAGIGWFTNFIAIKMLFHPKKPIKILFFTLQGIFPKRQKALAAKLGQVVGRELFSIEDLMRQIQDADTSGLMAVVDKKLDQFIHQKLSSEMPMLSMFLSDDLKNKIKTTLKTEVEAMLPELMDSFGNQLKQSVDIEKTVQEKVEAFSTDQLEKILQDIMKKEFKFIELLGAILGFIIGLFQVFLLSFEQ